MTNSPYHTVKSISAAGKRWRRQDWIDLAKERLKGGGPTAVTLDQLCIAAGRSRGSFYHHFESIETLLVEVARGWFASETDAIAEKAAGVPDPLSHLAIMVKLTDAVDHHLERGVRVMAMANLEIAAIVEAADARREEVMRGLLTQAYRLNLTEAASASRLFHALHQAAVMRSPGDIKGYTRATIRDLVAWLPKR